MVTQYALADITPGYVEVPGGYAAQACVHELPSGSIIDATQKTITLNGSVIAQVEECNSPKLETVIPMLTNSTHNFANAETDINGTAFPNYLYATMTVPPIPASTLDHWNALWTGMHFGPECRMILTRI